MEEVVNGLIKPKRKISDKGNGTSLSLSGNKVNYAFTKRSLWSILVNQLFHFFLLLFDIACRMGRGWIVGVRRRRLR